MKRILLFMGLALISLGILNPVTDPTTQAPVAHAETALVAKAEEPVNPEPVAQTTQVEPAVEDKVEPAAPQQAPTAVVPQGTHDDWLAAAGITDTFSANILISRENGSWDPCKMNGGAIDCAYLGDRAYGIPQALPGSKMASAGADWQTNPITQLKWMNTYVNDRYGSWAQALAFHYQNKWY
jgi:hypothetical protein